MILVSSCLGGIECRYNGSHAASEKIRRLVEEKKAVMVCPELLGGFTTPREPAEIIGGTGEDVTALYMDGAAKTLAYAKEIGADTVILKENSPSCGSSFIYDGTFSGQKIFGDGITSALLKQAGCRVISENELDQL
ncbi:DUF523 domain-containing protein [Bacillus sp. ISL-51]|uniref:DUF523 domain-containing protein n=1 Tax=Bacteria TaxID=2 RepID=UPI001BEA1D01|nr:MULTISPECIES: DUF523 domain-containing protein [Bacteria]MBT2574708.1 DUF523 domain-containing protein [Bacillus sp. ISL-51]MBT2636273.1 DUF523 domain-containing protein [Bacillus sp. ISL-26]MBT2711254.1 DUF523 domain-containing protein [Pseudomonas sp. ISL-88]